MSGFKQHLELAQSFQNEMADVEDLSVIVSAYSIDTVNGNRGGNYVALTVIGNKEESPEHFSQLIDNRITAESLAELKKDLKRLGYEV